MSEKTSDVPETFPKTVWLRENDGVLEFTDEGDPCGFAYSAGQSEDSARFQFATDKMATIYCSAEDNGKPLHWVFVDETQKDRRGIIGKTIREAIDKARKANSNG